MCKYCPAARNLQIRTPIGSLDAGRHRRWYTSDDLCFISAIGAPSVPYWPSSATNACPLAEETGQPVSIQNAFTSAELRRAASFSMRRALSYLPMAAAGCHLCRLLPRWRMCRASSSRGSPRRATSYVLDTCRGRMMWGAHGAVSGALQEVVLHCRHIVQLRGARDALG